MVDLQEKRRNGDGEASFGFQPHWYDDTNSPPRPPHADLHAAQAADVDMNSPSSDSDRASSPPPRFQPSSQPPSQPSSHAVEPQPPANAPATNAPEAADSETEPEYYRVQPSLSEWDVLHPDFEMREDDDPPPQPEGFTIGWIVYCGTETGCFDKLFLVTSYTTGVSGNRFQMFKSWTLMWQHWRAACLTSTVMGPLSDHSLIRKVVPLKEVMRRLRTWQLDEWKRQQRNAAIAAALAEPAAKKSDAAAAEQSAAPVAPAAPADLPAATADVPAANDTATTAATAASATAFGPAAARDDGENVERRWARDQGAGGDVHPGIPALNPISDASDDEGVDPPAWVVIRGVRPGVYYYRCYYMEARGRHPEAWGFPAPSQRRADRLWLKNIAHVKFLPY